MPGCEIGKSAARERTCRYPSRGHGALILLQRIRGCVDTEARRRHDAAWRTRPQFTDAKPKSDSEDVHGSDEHHGERDESARDRRPQTDASTSDSLRNSHLASLPHELATQPAHAHKQQTFKRPTGAQLTAKTSERQQETGKLETGLERIIATRSTARSTELYVIAGKMGSPIIDRDITVCRNVKQ